MYPFFRVGGSQVCNQMRLYRGYACLTLSTSVVAEGKPIAKSQGNKKANEELYGFHLCNFFLRECINMKSISQGKRVHSHIVKSNFEEDAFFQNNLINMYGKCGSVENARKVFDKMHERNVYSWTLMIGEYVHHGHCEEALKLFSQLKQEAGIELSQFTVVSVVRACAKIAGLQFGKLVHADLIKTGFQSDVIVGTALVDMYAKTGVREDAHQVFDKMPEKNVFSWTVIISEYAKHGHGEEVFKLFKGLLFAGVKPNHFTFSSVLSVGSMLDSLEQGRQVHAQIIKTGFDSYLFVGNALVDMYAKWGSRADANKLFDNMPEIDMVSWTGLMSGYANDAENRYGKEALELFSQMTCSGTKPDNFILALVLKVCACIASLQSGQELHAYIIKTGYEVNASVINTLVDMYGKCGSILDACKVFDEMEEPNLISCNAMISGYTRHGLDEDALQLFHEMRQERMISNGFTFVSVVTACANLAAQEQGKCIHADIVKSGFAFDLFVGNALVGMYAKCGSMKDASLVFDRMLTWDVVSWNSMIAGYADHNFGVEAFQLVAEMLRFGINPNQVTFTSILKACARLLSGEKWQAGPCLHYQNVFGNKYFRG